MSGPGGQGKRELEVGDEGREEGKEEGAEEGEEEGRKREKRGRRVEKIGEFGGREKDDIFACSKKGGRGLPLSTSSYISVHPNFKI